jgi:Carboxypeptidase regulatory-like domain
MGRSHAGALTSLAYWQKLPDTLMRISAKRVCPDRLQRNKPGGSQMNNLTGLVHAIAGKARGMWVSGFMAAVFLLLLMPLNVYGQAVSRINGEVTDQGGAVVPDAKVTVTNVDTNVAKTTTTTSAGTYLIIDLIPGAYVVKVEKSGFRISVTNNVVVVGGATSTANAILQPGTVSQTIEVNAPSVELQTEQPEIGTTLPEQLAQDLPQLVSGSNRQIDNFIFLVPGVTGNGFSHRINGGVDQQTEVMFNGIPEAFSETAGYTFWNQPPYDSIKDVDVLTGTFSAQYGLGQGVEQYHAKSGTNAFHGNALFLYRDDRYFGAPGAYYDTNPNPSAGNKIDVPSPDIETNWAFSLGGPVYIPKVYNGRNKTFWYFAYDRYRKSFGQTPITLPTAAEVGGDFSGLVNAISGAPIPIYVPIAWASNPSLIPAGCNPGAAPGSQFPGNKIPTSCFSQVSAGVLSQYPLPAPNAPGHNGINNFAPTTILLNLQTDYSINIDHNLTTKQALHGIYWQQKFPQPSGTDWVNSPLNGEQITTILGRGLNVTYSNAINSRLVVTGGFMYVYQGNDFLPTNLLKGQFAGALPSGLSGQPNVFPSVGFGGGGWEPQPFGPGNGLTSTINHKKGFSYLGNVLYIKGRHTMNAGVDVRTTHQDDFECGGSGGQPGCAGIINFTSDITANPTEAVPGATSGNGFASFLLGDATLGGRGGAGNTNLRNTYVAPYFQDDIQLKPKLKVNWGIRWDLAFPFKNDFHTNQLTYFDPNAVNTAEISTKTGQPLLGAMAELGTCNGCSGWSQQTMNWHHFSPRAGFTYQLNPKTVVLGGASWYWLDTGSFEYGVNKVAVNYGNNLNGVVSIGQPGATIPGLGQWDTNPLPGLPAVGFSPTFFNGVSILGGAQVHELPKTVNQAYDEQFVIGVQRELPWNTFLSVHYVHTHDLHLPATLQSAKQSLNYSFVKSVCPQGPSVEHTLDCQLAHPWTDPLSQSFMAGQGIFGQVPGGCGSVPGPLYAPYTNFCQEQGASAQLFVAELPYPHMPFVTNNFDTTGADKYNALQVSLQKRTGAGLTYLVSYTLSKYLTNTDSGFSTFNFRGIDPNNPNQEWSVGNNDQTHVLTIAGVYELPIGPGKKFLNRPGVLGRNLLGGWKFTTTNYYESGTPLPINACGGNQFNCDPLIGNIFVGNRPNLVSNNFHLNWNNYYKGLPVVDYSAFSAPGDWTIGNARPRISAFRAPPYFDEDISFGKKFYFGERFSADLTIQFFNVLNRFLLNNGPANSLQPACFDGNFLDQTQYGAAANTFGLAGVNGANCQGNTPRRGQAQFRIYF